jgi:hypothetical protein
MLGILQLVAGNDDLALAMIQIISPSQLDFGRKRSDFRKHEFTEAHSTTQRL